MEITICQQDEVTVISIDGDLDATTAEEAAAFLDSNIDQGCLNMAIDLSQVIYLSSAGLRVIHSALMKTRNAGGDVRLGGAQDNVKRVIDLAGFPKFIKTFDTIEQAVASFAQ